MGDGVYLHIFSRTINGNRTEHMRKHEASMTETKGVGLVYDIWDGAKIPWHELR